MSGKRKRPMRPAERKAWLEKVLAKGRRCDGMAGQKPCVRRLGHPGRCSSAVDR